MPADLTAARSRVMAALKAIRVGNARYDAAPCNTIENSMAAMELTDMRYLLGDLWQNISALLTAGPMTGAEAAAIALRLLDRWNNDRVFPSCALADAILAANRSGYLAGLAREAEMEFEIAALRSTIEQLSQPPGTVTTA